MTLTLTPSEERKVVSDRLRKQREPVTNVMGTGLNLNERGEIINRQKVVIVPGADYGSDPLGDDMHRMVPSGDIVDGAERKRRLGR